MSIELLLYVLTTGVLLGLSTTIYLHRCATHGGVILRPVSSHFFRFVLWFFNGIKTREWVAVHRLHHKEVESERDPHSPQVLGLWRVLILGVVLYQKATKSQETLARYGKGCPDDWVERHVYAASYNWIGPSVLLPVLNFALFGWWGLLAFLIQRLWVGFWAGGIINGLGHYLGSRSFKTPDASRNILPRVLSFLLSPIFVGEDWHNNHHHAQASPKFSARWSEFDLGWLVIRVLSFLGQATIRRVPATDRPFG